MTCVNCITFNKASSCFTNICICASDSLKKLYIANCVVNTILLCPRYIYIIAHSDI